MNKDNNTLIVSCYFKHNYGSMLQAYASQKILDDLGIKNNTVNITKNLDFKNGKKKYYLSQLFNFSFIKSKFGMIKFSIDRKINKNLKKNFAIRENKFKEFESKFNLTEPTTTYEDLTKMCDNYSNVLVGSDQLWLPVNVVADYYTLNWVPNEKNKISYATSFGISNIPNKYKNEYTNFLNRIDHLSVREEAGVKIVNDLTDKKCSLVCDPTLLFNKEEWEAITPKDRLVKDKYIFCYFLGKNILHRKFVERLKKETGYKIVSINHCDEYVKYSDKFADETPYDIGPGEFINLIKNAEYVCTDSFHGTVFSLINNVKFFTFRRFNKKSKHSTNSRVESLLNIVELKDRLLFGDEEINKDILKEIDFKEVNSKINSFVQSSKEFLIEALK